ncbi:hypothetical protein V6N13_035987 [Hibiscus sabdariffa]
MLNSLPRNRQLHVFLEEDVEPITRTDSDILSERVKPVTTKTHIRTEAVEPITRTDIRTESEDDSEDSGYVVVDSSDGDSGFEESEIDISDEEGFAHGVYVGIHTEMDCTNLNSDLLGGLPAITLDDENVGVDDCTVLVNLTRMVNSPRIGNQGVLNFIMNLTPLTHSLRRA